MDLTGLVEILDVLRLIFMNKYTLVFTVGLFAGWHLPMPPWAHTITSIVKALGKKVVEWIKG